MEQGEQQQQQPQQQQQQQHASRSAPRQESGRRQQPYSDEFMMYTFKVEPCKRVDKHDREQCPYAHPGELARRRHPSLYQALPCPEARAKKICPRLENCNCSHSTFEFWLHPDRYKTFLCERGEQCDRPICFFAHSQDELRELPQGLQRTQQQQSHHHHQQQRADPAAASSSGGGWSPGPVYQAQASQLQQREQQGMQGAAESSGSGAGSAGHGRQAGGSHSRHQQHQQQAQQQQRGGQQPPHPPGDGRAQQQRQQQQQPHGASAAGGPVLMYGGVPAAAGSQPGMLVVRPDAHRGTTVAVIPAGPSVWQNNSALLTDTGEAPTLEELCAAVNRMAVQQQQQQQQGEQTSSAPQPGFVQQWTGQYPLPVLGSAQPLPGMAPLPIFALPQQPQQQQPPQQLVFVQLPQPQRDASGASTDQYAWGTMSPGR